MQARQCFDFTDTVVSSYFESIDYKAIEFRFEACLDDKNKSEDTACADVQAIETFFRRS